MIRHRDASPLIGPFIKRNLMPEVFRAPVRVNGGEIKCGNEAERDHVGCRGQRNNNRLMSWCGPKQSGRGQSGIGVEGEKAQGEIGRHPIHKCDVHMSDSCSERVCESRRRGDEPK